MFKHNILELFGSFSKDEISRFEKYLSNNSSMKMLKLYHEIIKHYPDFDSALMDKNALSVNTSLSGTNNNSTLRDALSELMRITMKYISISNFENNNFESANLVLEELSRRGSTKVLQKKIREAEEYFESNNIIDSRFQYNKYWFDSLVYNFETTNSKIIHKPKAIEKVDKLSELCYTLLNFCIPEIISLHLNAKLLSEKYNVDYTETSLSKIVALIDLKNLIRIYEDQNPATFKLYKLLMDMFENFEKDQYYFRYKDYLAENSRLFSFDEVSFHYNWLISYCIARKSASDGYGNFDTELFELYNTFLENRYYVNRKTKYLAVDMFRDILLHALGSENYVWAEEFIVNYCSEIEPDERENLVNFSYAHLYYNSGQTGKALEYYRKIKMDNFIFKYDIKILILKIYTELNYFEEALSEIKAFREFLRNNPMVSASKKTRFGNFVRHLEKLILYMAGKDSIDVSYLKSKLMKEKSLTQKKWLIDKINSLPKVRSAVVSCVYFMGGAGFVKALTHLAMH